MPTPSETQYVTFDRRTFSPPITSLRSQPSDQLPALPSALTPPPRLPPPSILSTTAQPIPPSCWTPRRRLRAPHRSRRCLCSNNTLRVVMDPLGEAATPFGAAQWREGSLRAPWCLAL